MSKIVFCCGRFVLLGLCFLQAMPSDATADQDPRSRHPEWLACRTDADCISVELGCWYWQPVGRKHAAEMKKTNQPVCLQSARSGPQPAVHCEDHLCVKSPNTVRYWKQLEAERSFFSIQSAWLSERMALRLQSAGIVLSSQDFITWRDRAIHAVDQKIQNP